MKFTHRIFAVTTSVLFFVPILSSCSGVGSGLAFGSDPNFVDAVSEAASSGEPFVLPRDGAPVASWGEVAVVCPYAVVDVDTPPVVARALEQIDTTMTDASQWLVFVSGSSAETLTLTRDDIDLCATGLTPNTLFPVDAQWTGQLVDGVWQVEPLVP